MNSSDVYRMRVDAISSAFLRGKITVSAKDGLTSIAMMEFNLSSTKGSRLVDAEKNLKNAELAFLCDPKGFSDGEIMGGYTRILEVAEKAFYKFKKPIVS